MILLGMTGIGKTSCANKYANCYDAESSDRNWIYKNSKSIEKRKGNTLNRIKNNGFPLNYNYSILAEHLSGKIVFAGLFPEVISFLAKNKVDWYACVYEATNCEKMLNRIIERGNSKSFQVNCKNSFLQQLDRSKDAKEVLTVSNQEPYIENILINKGFISYEDILVIPDCYDSNSNYNFSNFREFYPEFLN